MIKKYKVILAAAPLTQQEQEAIDALTTGGAAKYITEFKKEIEKYKNLDPGAYEKKLQEVVEFYKKEDELTNQIATKLDLSIPLATAYITDVVTTFGIGRPDAINLMSSVFNSASTFGFSRDEAFDYMKELWEKYKSPTDVAKRVAEDFKSIQDLAIKAEVQPIEIFDVFFEALKSGNFRPVWALITAIPILKINLLNKETSNMKSIASEALPIIERFQGISLPRSERGQIITSLEEAANAMKFAFNPILDYLSETMIQRQITFFGLAKRDFQNKPNTFKALYDSHNKLDADFYNLQQRRDMVNRQSTFAPASDLVTPSKEVKSNVLNKYKIIVAAPSPPTTAPAGAPASSAPTTTPGSPSTTPAAPTLDPSIEIYNTELRVLRSLIVQMEEHEHAADLIKQSLDTFLMPQQQGLEGDIVATLLDISSAEEEFEKFKVEVDQFKFYLSKTISKINEFINNPQFPPQLDSILDPIRSQITKSIAKSNKVYDTQIKELSRKMLAAPILKEFEDKKKAYDSGKSRINSPSTKFVVPVKVFNPITKTFQRFDVPRGQFILHVGKIGEDCVALLRQLAAIFSQESDKNAQRSVKRFLESANQLEAENEEFISKNLNPFAPSVGEPR